MLKHIQQWIKVYSTLSWTHLFFSGKGRVVTDKIYEHYASEQCKFKKDFVIMNQKSRQKATSLIEIDSANF